MKLKNILVVVKDIEKSKKFYCELFGLDVVLNNEANVILTEGLVLQEEEIWQECIGTKIAKERNSSVLYFEESNIERFAEKLQSLYPETIYVTPLQQYEWGQKVMRFYDPDGNLIEVRTPQ